MPRVDEQPVVETAAGPYDVEERIPVREAEPEPDLASAPEQITEAQPESAELVSDTPAAGEGEPIRKRRASSGIKRKTVAPRKSAGTTVKRARKKVSPPPEEGSTT